MYAPIPTTLLFTSMASAAAISLLPRQGTPVWTNPDGPDAGNTKVRFGDEKVYVGGCDPLSILDSVAENCYGEGFCNADSWSMQCIQGDSATHTVQITAPEGQYQAWIKNGLVDAMKAAISQEGIVEKERITAMSGGGCVGCTWYPKDITVYHMPGTIGISHNNDGTVPDVITLKIENKDDDAGSGMCEILTGIGGAVAGAVNGVAGGVFSLGSLACGAI